MYIYINVYIYKCIYIYACIYIYKCIYIYTHLWRDCHDSPNFPLNFVRAVRASNAGSPSPKSRTKLPVPGPPRRPRWRAGSVCR